MSFSQKATGFAQKTNYYLERLIPVTTPLGILMGFFLPEVFIHLRPFVPWLFGLMTFSGALKLRARELGNTVRSPVPIIWFFVCAHLLMPVIAMFSSSLFFKEIDIVTGFVLLFAGPTAVSGFFWVLIYKGDKALALSLILLSTVLAPLILPATLYVLIGKTVSMDMSGIALSLAMMVLLPTIIGVAVNETSRGKIPEIICPYLDPISKICLIMVIAANVSPVAPKIQFRDPLVWKTAIVCIFLTILGFVLIYVITIIIQSKKDKGISQSISLVIAAGLKNNSAVMTIAVTFFPEAAALPTIMSILIQQSVAALVGKALAGKGRDAD